jgi:type I restriction enzyme S subunit
MSINTEQNAFAEADPAVEPASVLLDRIRIQRAAAPKLKRGRRTKAAA